MFFGGGVVGEHAVPCRKILQNTQSLAEAGGGVRHQTTHTRTTPPPRGTPTAAPRPAAPQPRAVHSPTMSTVVEHALHHRARPARRPPIVLHPPITRAPPALLHAVAQRARNRRPIPPPHRDRIA